MFVYVQAFVLYIHSFIHTFIHSYVRMHLHTYIRTYIHTSMYPRAVDVFHAGTHSPPFRQDAGPRECLGLDQNNKVGSAQVQEFWFNWGKRFYWTLRFQHLK